MGESNILRMCDGLAANGTRRTQNALTKTDFFDAPHRWKTLPTSLRRRPEGVLVR